MAIEGWGVDGQSGQSGGGIYGQGNRVAIEGWGVDGQSGHRGGGGGIYGQGNRVAIEGRGVDGQGDHRGGGGGVNRWAGWQGGNRGMGCRRTGQP